MVISLSSLPKKRQGCVHWYSLLISLLPQTVCYEKLPFFLPQYGLSHLLRRAANTKIPEKPFPVACQYENRQHFSSLHCLSTTSLQETHLPYSLVPSLIWGEALFSMGAVLLPYPPQPHWWLPTQVTLKKKILCLLPNPRAPGLRFPLRVWNTREILASLQPCGRECAFSEAEEL